MDSAYSNQVDFDDALKIANAATTERISIFNNEKQLTADLRSIPTQGDTAQLFFEGARKQSYRFQMLMEDCENMKLIPVLVDRYNGSEVEMVQSAYDYEFVVNSFNWCRYNSNADKYSWAENWAANQVKTDVQTTSSQDLITPAIKTISTAKDFCQFVNSYYKFKGDLYNDIDKYVYTSNKWSKIREAIPRDFKITAKIPVCKKFVSGSEA